jgi:hypothetical protein
MPKGFRKGHGGDVACPHRDLSCCRECAKQHPELVDVYGQHFWVPVEADRAELLKSMEVA